MNESKSILRRATDKLFGGINMSWPVVIIYAVASAVLTSLFLIVPVFEKSSFHLIGETFEAWVLFAVIIMANCKKPLESALKTFVFFLISQPLIYLFQVPFNSMGFGLFGYYYYWFIWTLFTFPMAFVGYYIVKKNWLSVLIFAPVLAFLAYTGVGFGKQAFYSFPYHLLACIFCFAQIALYIYVFMPKLKMALTGIAVTLVTVIVCIPMLFTVDYGGNYFLPDEPKFSENAQVIVDDSSLEISISDHEEGMIDIRVHRYGSSDFKIKDGDKEYKYSVFVYEENGNPQLNVKAK